MSIIELLSGLQPWDKDEYISMGLSDEYIDMVNDANVGYRDHVLSKLNLKPTLNLYGGNGGGNIKLDFTDIHNKLPMNKIISIIESYGEDYVKNQIGGGFFNWIKGLILKRNFDTFKARYDKLRSELDNKIAQFDVESRGMKVDVEENAKYMKELLLNAKFIIMAEIRLDNDPNMSYELRKFIENELELAKEKEIHILESIKIYKKIVEKRTKSKIYFFGLFKSDSQIVKLSNSYQKTAEEFNEIYKQFSKIFIQTLEMKSLKARFGSLTPDIKKLLTSDQKKEYEKWDKNKEKYEKMEAFTENNMNEANKLIQKQAELNILINNYNTAFMKLDSQKGNAQKVLINWNNKLRSIYTKIVMCIELGIKYKGILDNAKQLIVNNSNIITSLSISAVESVLKEYELHILSVDYTSNLMAKLVATIGEIKNNFIKLVPSQNLQADILYVGSARTYLLTLIENIRRRQVTFSGGEKYLKDVIKGKVRGGALKIQTGGIYLEQTNYNKYPLYFLHTYPKNIVTRLPYNPNTPTSFEEYSKVGNLDLNLTEIIQVPYGIILYDTNDNPGIKTDIATNYDKWIATNDTKDTMILPILDFNEEVIKIYKIKYNDISDIKNIDISCDFIKEINITTRNKQAFIFYEDYIIYNIYVDPDEVDTIKDNGIKINYYEHLYLQNSKCVILPVFKNIRTSADMIVYDEYHLLNPLSGLPILATAEYNNSIKEIILEFQTYTNGTEMDTIMSNAINKGRIMYYHFNAVGIKYKIIDDVNHFSIDYGAGPEQFRMHNVELANLTNVIDYHWGIMYKLTIIINSLFKSFLHENTTIDEKTKSVNFDIKNTKFINAYLDKFDVGLGSIDKDDHTKITLNNMNLNIFTERFFGGDPRLTLIIIRKIINKEIKLDNGSLLFDPTTIGSTRIDDIDKNIIDVAIPKQDSLTPKQRQVFDQIIRMIPKTSPYWSNQGIILNMIEEFFKSDYKDKFELVLHDIQNLVYDIRMIEGDILKINVNVLNKDEILKYTLITEELEVKPNELKLGEAGDVITNAGKDLRTIVQNSSEFANKFAAQLGVNESNIITLLEEDNFLYEAWGTGKTTFAEWVRNPARPDRLMILNYLENPILAGKFIDQLKKHPIHGSHIRTITERLTADGGVSKFNAKAAYDLIRSYVGNAGPRDAKPAQTTQVFAMAPPMGPPMLIQSTPQVQRNPDKGDKKDKGGKKDDKKDDKHGKKPDKK